MSNIIPEIGATGSFVALAPFDRVVDPQYMYTVEALRTPEELHYSKADTYLMIGEPAGLSKEDTKALMDEIEAADGVVVTIAAPGLDTLHVPSIYFKSFPQIDGVLYERLCFIIDLGAVPPAMKDQLNAFQVHLKDQAKAITGIADPEVHVGVTPTKAYVSKEQAEVFENTRKAQITKSAADTIRIRELEESQIKDRKYIAILEEQLRNRQ